MELFSEIYNCYYQVVDRILKDASQAPISKQEMIRLADRYGYGESAFAIIPHLINGDWDLLVRDGTLYSSKIDNLQVLPLTTLQKSWLKSLLSDPRLRLFLTDQQLELMETYLSDVQPLFSLSDFIFFDQYSNGDSTTSCYFREHFQTIIRGIKSRQTLTVSYYSGKGKEIQRTYLPCRIEYSEKDDKFRAFMLFKRNGRDWRFETLNIGRILHIKETGFYVQEEIDIDSYLERALCEEPVVLEISNERNALERTLLHFSCYEKRIERLGESGKYLCSIFYHKSVETELLIQVLSFGPVIRVLGPENFLQQIRTRVQKQARLLQHMQHGEANIL